MTASIILCTRNRCQALAETLQSLNTVAVPDGLKAEVIVMDNGSTDDTAKVVQNATVKNMQVEYLPEPKAGKANALNSGLKRARGEILLFTDDDVRFDSGWLQCLTQPIVDGNFDALAGRVCVAPHLRRPWMTDWHLAWIASTDYLNRSEPEAAVGANMSFSRRVLERVPQFDPELGPGQLGLYEDTLFSMQMKRAGCRLGMANDAVVEHHFDESRLNRSSFLSHAARQGRSQAYVTWHWEHEDRSCPGLRATRRELELLIKRAVKFRECRQSEGIPVWEMKLVTGIAFLRQFKKECQRPRAYEKHGARKILC